MDTKKQLTLAWAVAGVLAIALIVALIALMNPEKNLGAVLQDGSDDLTEQRDRIAEACEGVEARTSERCKRELDGLSDILRDFSREIDRATDGATAPSATVTATTTIE